MKTYRDSYIQVIATSFECARDSTWNGELYYAAAMRFCIEEMKKVSGDCDFKGRLLKAMVGDYRECKTNYGEEIIELG